MRRKQIVYGLLILMLFSSSCGAVSPAPEKAVSSRKYLQIQKVRGNLLKRII